MSDPWSGFFPEGWIMIIFFYKGWDPDLDVFLAVDSGSGSFWRSDLDTFLFEGEARIRVISTRTRIPVVLRKS